MKKLRHKPMMVDPPSGWQYGFPKLLPAGEIDMAEWLANEGYPKKDIKFALKHMRVWYINDGPK